MKKIINTILNTPEVISSPPVLVDIGASGQLHKKWRSIAKYSICVAFDADDREFGFIEKEQSKFKKLFVYNCIVSDETVADKTFYLTKSPYCSSILQPDLDNLSNYSYADIFRIDKTIKLKTVSISKALKDIEIERVDWFKTDSQGLDLRLFKNLDESIRSKIIVSEFEPGLINAYKNEDKLFAILEYFDKYNFWLSDFVVKGVPRISSDLFTSIYRNKKLSKLLSLSMKRSPGWGELTYLNSFSEDDNFAKREYLIGCLFSLIENQFGFAYELSHRGFNKFNDPVFNMISDKALSLLKQELYKMKFVPSLLKRFKELYL